MAEKYPDTCSLILVKEGKVYLQHRDNKPGIMSPGMLSTFGGAIEPGESPEEAIVREVAEELNGYKLKGFSPLCTITWLDYKIFIFVKQDDAFDVKKYKVTEGQGGVFVTEKDIEDPRIVRFARDALKRYFSVKRGQDT